MLLGTWSRSLRPLQLRLTSDLRPRLLRARRLPARHVRLQRQRPRPWVPLRSRCAPRCVGFLQWHYGAVIGRWVHNGAVHGGWTAPFIRSAKHTIAIDAHLMLYE